MQGGAMAGGEPTAVKPFVRFATPAALFVAALVVRLLPWHSVFQTGGVYPIGNDAYYHLRRIRYTLENFPEVLRFDPLMNFPGGGQAIWTPTFDWLIAALLWAVSGLQASDPIEPFVVWVPPILGAATVVLVYVLGSRFFSRRVGTLAALSMTLLPAHSLYSRLGAVDHHVLVATTVAVMLLLAMHLFTDAPVNGVNEKEVERGKHRSSVALGVSIAVAVLVWPGSLLHVGFLQLALVIRLLTAGDALSAERWATRFAVVHLTAFVLVLPLTVGNEWLIWGPFSPVVLSNFQPVYFFAAAVCFGLLGGMWRMGWGASTLRARIASAGLLGGGLIIAVLLVVPDLLVAISDALSWFAKDEDFQSVVNESVPIFSGEHGRGRAENFLGRFVYLTPLALAYFAWRDRDRPEVLLLLGFGLALFAETLVQWRFMNSLSIVYSLLIALTVDAVLRSSRLRQATSIQRAGAVAVLIALLVVLFAPSGRTYRPHVRNFGRMLRGEETVPVGSQLHARFVADAARYLKDNSPARSSPFEAADYSVLGPWGDGHVLKTIGERAVVQDNFGDDVAPENFALAEDYFSEKNEARALELVAPLKTRYVLVRSSGSGHSNGYSFDSLFSRLHLLRGGRGALPGTRDQPISVDEPLAHHRLIYQSSSMKARDREPYVMLFEIVAGAEVVGTAPPESIVSAKIDIDPREGSPFIYVASATTTAEGVYQLRLPYSNGKGSSGENVRTGSHYTIRNGTSQSPLVIADSAVLAGARIEGPGFVDPLIE